METAVKTLFNQTILANALERFGLDSYPKRPLDGFENFLIEVNLGSSSRILRLSHSSKKSEQNVSSELAYLHYLASNKANVALPVLSEAGRLIEAISDDEEGFFYAVCFEKAPGKHPDDKAHKPDLYYTWGKAMGNMHQLSTNYQAEPSLARIHWDEEVEVTQPEKYIPADQWLLLEKYQQTISRLRTLPIAQDSYGVIHNDLHSHNFLFDGQRLTMIDFEDAVQMWYVSDIAITMFMTSVWPPKGLSREDFVMEFLPPFLSGYRSEKAIDETCLYRLPLFLKFREIGQYVAMHRAADMENMDPWVEKFMYQRRERIENDVPVYKIHDWGQFL